MKSGLKTILINLIIFIFLVSGVSIFYLLIIRANGKYAAVDRTSSSFRTIDDCLNTPHGKVSIQQAKLLGETLEEIRRYCSSKISTRKEPELFAYWDYHYYSAREMKTEAINFMDNEDYFSRKVPCSTLDEIVNSTHIWMFGGSTMQNMETSDEYTIANAFCANLNIPAKVLNLGTGSFFAELETQKLLNIAKLRLRKEKYLPDIAIFYDGYNDSEKIFTGGHWTGLPGRLSRKFMNSANLYPSIPFWVSSLNNLILKIKDISIDIAGGNANAISNFLDRLSNYLISRHLSNLNNSLLTEEISPSIEVDGMLLSTKSYIHDQKVLKGICDGLEIKCITVLQPMVFTRNSPIGKYELMMSKLPQAKNVKRFYREVDTELLKLEKESEFFFYINLSSIVNQPKFKDLPFFYDQGHTGFYSSKIIGKIMSERVREKLNL